MEIYLVGGAVRDQLLDLPQHERDWVVVGASEQEMLEAGYSRADSVFPVFIHPESGEEYALARTEVKTGPGYKGFRVYAGPDVTLEQDLLRRDLSINALAMDAEGKLVDVCGGREDLDQGLLRHITPAFVEDPVRLLRIARFSAKLGKWGFRIAHGTHGLMRKMATSDDLLSLKPERIWQELRKAMDEPQPWRFFEVLHRCGALQHLLPELAAAMGKAQAHRSGPEVDAMVALKRVAAQTSDGAVRFAVAFYPAAHTLADPTGLLRRVRAGRVESERLMDLLALAPFEGSLDAPALLRVIDRLKPERQSARYQAFMLACGALWPETMERLAPRLVLAREAVKAVDVAALRARGLEGAELGAVLRQQRMAELEARLATIPGSG